MKIATTLDHVCCSIRFYDNQPDIIEQFMRSKRFIESILVSNKPNQEVMNGDPNAKYYTDRFLATNPRNKFAKYLKSIGNEEIETDIGFTMEREGKDLFSWASKHPEKKIVLFDWDGTLSVVEGLLLPEYEEEVAEFHKKDITTLEIATYYCGSRKRLQDLRRLFIKLYERWDVEFFILTNNPVATCDPKKSCVGPISKSLFFLVVKEIFPFLPFSHILCGFDTNCFKPDTFSNETYLRKIYKEIQHWHFEKR